jgi:excinuclease ABC subunit B
MEGAYPGAPLKAKQYAKVAQEMAEYASLTPSQMMKKVKQLEKEMYKHAENLEFEEAAKVRDKLRHLRGEGLVA